MKKNSVLWDSNHREISWTVLMFSRKGLNLTTSPTIVSAFILLHHYFQKNTSTSYDLYMLLTSSLFLACKIEDMFRPMNLIFLEFTKSCVILRSHFSDKLMRMTLGNRNYENSDLAANEITQISQIEIEILNSIKWNMNISIPFTHYNAHRKIISTLPVSQNVINNIDSGTLINLGKIVKDPKCIHISDEASAAAAFYISFQKNLQETKTIAWINDVKERLADDFESACNIIQVES